MSEELFFQKMGIEDERANELLDKTREKVIELITTKERFGDKEIVDILLTTDFENIKEAILLSFKMGQFTMKEFN